MQILWLSFMISLFVSFESFATTSCKRLFAPQDQPSLKLRSEATIQVKGLSHLELFQRILEVSRSFRRHIQTYDLHPEELASDIPLILSLAKEALSVHLPENLERSDREQFDLIMNDFEQIIIAQLQKSRQGSTSMSTADSIKLLSVTAKLIAPRVHESVRVEIGKILIQELLSHRELSTEIFEILKIWRYQPNESEINLILKVLFLEWKSTGAFDESALLNFSKLPHFVQSLPSKSLQPFVGLAKRWLHSDPAKLKQNYIGFLWALLELNPIVANQFAAATGKMGAMKLPKAHGAHMQQVRGNQLNFINNYFKKVLKSSISWLVEEERRFAKFEVRESTTTLYQRELLEALRLQGFSAVIEYQVPPTNIVVDLIVAQIGSRGRIIEVDGELHFLVDENFKKSLRPLDTRRDELLRALGYSVQRLTNSQAHSEAEKLRFIARQWEH